jgi:alpha-galactosidase
MSSPIGGKAMTRIAMMGAGSAVFCRKLVQDILSFESLKDAHIALMDIDGAKLKTTLRVMENMRQQHNLSCTFSATTDRREALRGADFAISMIMVGGLEAYDLDISIPLKYGVDQCVGDTINPGGVFRGLRHVPALLDMLGDAEEVCPDVLFMNYANPMAICSWAMQRTFPHIVSVGLCHGVQHTTKLLCIWLDVNEEDCETLVAGINHMAWFLRFRHKGEDLYPRIWQKLEKEGPIRFEHYRFEMMKATGYFMTEMPGHLSEYLPYFRHRSDLKEIFNGPWLMGETGGYLNYLHQTKDRYDSEMAAMAAGEAPVPYKLGRRSVEFAAEIMNAKLTGEPTQFAGNVLNRGFITNLPYDCCVEVPIFVDRSGLHPTFVGDLPKVCAALCRSNVSVQELAVEAALNGDYEAAYHACLVDPLTSAALAPHEIQDMTDEMFEAQIQWLPQFKGKSNMFAGATAVRMHRGVTEVKSGRDVWPEVFGSPDF